MTEHDEHRLRSRRSYAEVANTPGGKLIKTAGLKPWPELNAKQREIVESHARQRDEEAAQMERFGAHAARSPQRMRV